MKLPRDISGKDLIKALSRLNYETTRQTSNHIRLITQRNGEHNITIPAHNLIKVGINAILKGVSEHIGTSRNELITFLFSYSGFQINEVHRVSESNEVKTLQPLTFTLFPISTKVYLTQPRIAINGC